MTGYQPFTPIQYIASFLSLSNSCLDCFSLCHIGNNYRHPAVYLNLQLVLYRQFKHCCRLPYSSAGIHSDEMSEFVQNGLYHLMFRWLCAHSRLDNHFHLSIHEIRREPSPISAPVLSLSADNEDAGLDFPNLAEPRAHEAQGSLSVECFFHRNYEDQSGFKWTGLHPLSISTLPDDLFLYVSAYFPFEEVYWIEFRLARVDQSTGETVGEHIFFLPRIETMMGNLHRMREQMLDMVSQAAFGATSPSFRLSLWPRMEPLPYSGHSTLSPLATLPMMPPMDPSFCVISGES